MGTIIGAELLWDIEGTTPVTDNALSRGLGGFIVNRERTSCICKTYLYPSVVSGKGPRKSTEILSKGCPGISAPCIGAIGGCFERLRC